MNRDFIIITVLFLCIISIWGIFFRERIGYILPNSLFTQHRRTPLRIWMIWLIRSMLILSMILIIIPISSTTKTTLNIPIQHRILILLDVSRSMLAEDILPNRIEAAKQSIAGFLSDRRDDMMGLIIFAGKPFITIPFSEDIKGIHATLSQITPYYIRQELPGLSGTAIGDAILLGNNTLSGAEQYGSIVLVTDGRHNLGIDPLIAADESAKKGIPIFSIAIGSEGSGTLNYTDPYTGKKITLLDEGGNRVAGGVDTELLNRISQITGGTSFTANSKGELTKQLATISQKIGRQTEPLTQTVIHTYRVEFFLILIFLILIERVMTERIFYKNRQ